LEVGGLGGHREATGRLTPGGEAWQFAEKQLFSADSLWGPLESMASRFWLVLGAAPTPPPEVLSLCILHMGILRLRAKPQSGVCILFPSTIPNIQKRKKSEEL
jgi:hypothetical protein